MAPGKPTLTHRMEAVEAALRRHPRKSRKQFVRDNWIAIAALILASIGLIIAYLAWWQPQWKQHAAEDVAQLIDKQVRAQIAEPIKQIQQIQVDLAKISSKLDIFYGLQKDRLKKIGDLAPPQFEHALPQLHDALQDAAALAIPISPAVRSAIQNNLLAVSTHGIGYWPTVAQYITYRSQTQQGASGFLLMLQREKDTRCFNHIPQPQGYMAGPFAYEGCVIDLGDHSEENISGFIAGLSKNGPDKHFIFSVCVVKYSGERRINPILAGAEFRNCFFVFSVDAAPPPFAQRLIRAMLESAGSTVKVPS